MSLIDPLKMKVWGTEAQRYAWRNRDRLLLSPHIDFTYKGFYGKQENTIIVLRGKEVFQIFKWFFFNWNLVTDWILEQQV